MEKFDYSRHGIVSGTTGSGKTTTTIKIAESMTAQGIAVMLVDCKGDLTSKSLNNGWCVIDPLSGDYSIPISSIEASVFTDMLQLTKAQKGVLDICWRVGKMRASGIDSIKDVISLCHEIQDNLDQYITAYGHISRASLGVVVRALLSLQDTGASAIFGKAPKKSALDMMFTGIHDSRKVAYGSRAKITILKADALSKNPVLYRALIVWMQSILYAQSESRVVKHALMIDEAHLLFSNIPRDVSSMLERYARLMRSKGTSLWYISQYPSDIPDTILGMLGSKWQHQLLGNSPKTLKAVKDAAACLMAKNGSLSHKALQMLGRGEVYVSLAQVNGMPQYAKKIKIIL